MDDRIKTTGHYNEPYAILGKREISINDYDDGSTVINGKVISADSAVPRLRRVSKYNFIIATQSSPYNSTYFDEESEGYFNGILNGRKSYDAFFEFMRNCREYHDNYDPFRDHFRDMLG